MIKFQGRKWVGHAAQWERGLKVLKILAWKQIEGMDYIQLDEKWFW
jgi:hypothetical protein